MSMEALTFNGQPQTHQYSLISSIVINDYDGNPFVNLEFGRVADSYVVYSRLVNPLTFNEVLPQVLSTKLSKEEAERDFKNFSLLLQNDPSNITIH